VLFFEIGQFWTGLGNQPSPKPTTGNQWRNAMKLKLSVALLAVALAMTACVPSTQPIHHSRGDGNGGGHHQSGGESLTQSRERSGEMSPNETNDGPNGTDDAGNDVGFGAISG
jgi:hypothetical protein